MFRIRELDVQLAESRNALSIERENDAEPYLTEFFSGVVVMQPDWELRLFCWRQN